MSTSKRQERPPSNSARKHPSGTFRDLLCFIRRPRRGASSARLFRPLESGRRKPRPDEFPQSSGEALPLADRRRLTQAPRLRKRPVGRHEPRQGRDSFSCSGALREGGRSSPLARVQSGHRGGPRQEASDRLSRTLAGLDFGSCSSGYGARESRMVGSESTHSTIVTWSRARRGTGRR